MKGGLQELINLYLYRDIDTKEPKCEVYFKDHLDAFECVNAGQLFGDLVYIAIEQRRNEFFREALEWVDRDTAIDVLDAHLITNTIKGVESTLHVAEVIFTCNWEFSALEETAILRFLDVLDKHNIQFIRSVFDAFVFSYRTYVPPCLRTEFHFENKGNFPRSQFVVFEDSSFADNAMLEAISNTAENGYVYFYECDTLQEVYMALLHYLSTEGFTIKKCAHCGRWFVPNKKSDEMYCMRLFNGKSCKESTTAEKRRMRLDNNPLQKKYNSINTNLANRAKATSIDDAERQRCQQALYDFRNEWISNKKTMSTEQLLQWLDSFKKGR